LLVGGQFCHRYTQEKNIKADIGLSELSDPFDSDEVDGAEDVDVNAREHGTENDECVDTELDDDYYASDAEMDQNLNGSDPNINHDTFISNSNPAGGFDCDSDRTQMDMLVSTPAMQWSHCSL